MYSDIINQLKSKGVEFQEGLTKDEIAVIENSYNIVFPPDLKSFLSFSLPVSKGFINWRDTSEENILHIKSRLVWPLEGMIFDIKHNSFWYDDWGVKPDSIDKAINVCEANYYTLPQLIPIYSHRYIPSEPLEVDNPVFSVYQTDIIYYGENLKSYLEVEFEIKLHKDIDFKKIKKIRFWSDIIDY